ncbi:UNKNOWN [Stylonychia lemnae]|uniref:Uncharacterized protein n=1 Tax=Stylonychia lemnae TaxID=5949 RepID=A0A078B5E8_STYLE|nr:UNKNOWN [Stylonychia lemnae]|eukprot:CDW88517.1 UNKNOWN [Stylonychia lemnae]
MTRDYKGKVQRARFNGGSFRAREDSKRNDYYRKGGYRGNQPKKTLNLSKNSTGNFRGKTLGKYRQRTHKYNQRYKSDRTFGGERRIHSDNNFKRPFRKSKAIQKRNKQSYGSRALNRNRISSGKTNQFSKKSQLKKGKTLSFKKKGRVGKKILGVRKDKHMTNSQLDKDLEKYWIKNNDKDNGKKQIFDFFIVIKHLDNDLEEYMKNQKAVIAN